MNIIDPILSCICMPPPRFAHTVAWTRLSRLLLDHPEADCVRSVVEAGQNPYKMWRIDQVTGRCSRC